MTTETIENASTQFINSDNPVIAILAIMLSLALLALAWYIKADKSRDKTLENIAVTMAVLTEVVRNHGKE